MDIKKLSEEIHANALKKGFWDGEDGQSIPVKLALIHSEVSEALEADRKGNYGALDYFKARIETVLNSMPKHSQEDRENEYAALYVRLVKDTFGAEMAGTIIRCLDLCKKLNINIEAHIEYEHRYNLTRPHKHGKKY